MLLSDSAENSEILSNITQYKAHQFAQTLRIFAKRPNFSPEKIGLSWDDNTLFLDSNDNRDSLLFYKLLLTLLMKEVHLSSKDFEAIYGRTYPKLYERELPEHQRRQAWIVQIFSELDAFSLKNLLQAQGLLPYPMISHFHSDELLKKYWQVHLFSTLFKLRRIEGFSRQEIYIYQHLHDLLLPERRAILFSPPNLGIVEKLIKCTSKLEANSALKMYLEQNELLKSLEVASDLEPKLHKFRRRHSGKLGNLAGFFLALTSAALVLSLSIATFGLGLAIVFAASIAIVNFEVYRRVIKDNIKEGLFSDSFIQNGVKRLHKITKPGYKLGLILGYFASAITAAALGLLASLAIIGLTVVSFGTAPALALGIAAGLTVFTGNTLLFGSVFKSLCAYLERTGFFNAWKRLVKNFKQNFLSLEDCRRQVGTQKKLSLALICKKVLRLAFQSLFVLGALVLSTIAAILFMMPLKNDAVNFIKASSALGDKVSVGIIIGVSILVSQLALALNASVRLFNAIGKKIGETIGNVFTAIEEGIHTYRSRGFNFFRKSLIEGIKLSMQGVLGSLKQASSYIKRHALSDIVKAGSIALYCKIFLPCAAIIGAFYSARLAAHHPASDTLIRPDNQLSDYPVQNMAIVAGTVSSTAVVLQYLPKKQGSGLVELNLPIEKPSLSQRILPGALISDELPQAQEQENPIYWGM